MVEDNRGSKLPEESRVGQRLRALQIAENLVKEHPNDPSYQYILDTMRQELINEGYLAQDQLPPTDE